MLQKAQMVKAKQAARRAQESLYDGVCSVIEYKAVTDKKTKVTRHQEVTVLEDQPCRLSFEKKAVAVQTDTAAAVSQGVRLFVSPEVDIKSGSKIVVTQNGKTVEYKASGEPAVYFTHQEIELELFKEWA